MRAREQTNEMYSQQSVVGIDPGESKLGLSVFFKQCSKIDYYLCDLRETVLVAAKQKKKAPAKKRAASAAAAGGRRRSAAPKSQKVSKRAPAIKYKRKKAVNLTRLPEIIEAFVRSMGDTIFKYASMVVIEEQKISVARIKHVALLLYQTIRLLFPHIPCSFVDPKAYRAHFGITVRKQDHPGATKQQLRLIRKRASFEETYLLAPRDKANYEKVFTVGGEFCVDPYEAGLAAVYAAQASTDANDDAGHRPLPAHRFYCDSRFMMCSLFNQTLDF